MNKEVGQLVPQYLAAGIRLRHHLYHRELPPEKALQRAKEKTLALSFARDCEIPFFFTP